MKTKKLSVSLAIKCSILLILVFSGIGLLTVYRVEKYNREAYRIQTTEAVNEMLYVIANTNSVLMQQLREYTMLSDTLYKCRDLNVIHATLQRKASKRYKEFVSIGYVDYATGKEYRDDGKVYDVLGLDHYSIMKNQRLKNKALQCYGDAIDGIYSICKDQEAKDEDGLCIGYYIGRVKVSYLQRFLNKMKGDFDSEKGTSLILNKDSMFICAPKEEVVLTKAIGNPDFKFSEKLENYIKNPIEKDSNGNRVTILGDARFYGKKYLVAVGVFSKTQWTLCACIPYSTIDSLAEMIIRFIILISVCGIIISIIVISTLLVKSFTPLKELGDAFNDVAKSDANLTKRIQVSDFQEIGYIQNGFNEFVVQLQNMVADIASSKNNLVEVESKLGVVFNNTINELKNIDATIDDIREEYTEEKLNKLDKSAAEVGFIANELEEIIKTSYKAVNNLDKNVRGLKY